MPRFNIKVKDGSEIAVSCDYMNYRSDDTLDCIEKLDGGDTRIVAAFAKDAWLWVIRIPDQING